MFCAGSDLGNYNQDKISVSETEFFEKATPVALPPLFSGGEKRRGAPQRLYG